MFTPKRTIDINSSRVTRSHSLKTKNETTQNLNLSGVGMNKLSLNLGLIYNDTLLQSYKSPLPIKINEIISKIKTQDSNDYTVTMLANGHICFAYEKKLYLWKIKKSLKNLQCIELSLPQSRSIVRKNCVSVECHYNKDYVALVVTSEGFLRYWPSIFNEYSCVDFKYDLQNDEIAQLMYMKENRYLMVTSNGQLISVVFEQTDDKINPIMKQVDISSGFMSSVGRRMTSLIFGSTAQFNLNKNIQNLKAAVRYSGSYDFFVLVDKNLQKFSINSDSSYSFVHQMNIEKLFFEEYLARNPEAIRASVILQSASITKNSIYILGLVEDNGFKFVIGEVNTMANENKLKSFHTLNYTLNNFDAQTQFSLQALDNQYTLYIYNYNLIILFTGPTFDYSGESKFNTLGDKLVDSDFYENELLFFSLNHGILKTKESSFKLNLEEDTLAISRAEHQDESTVNDTISDDRFEASTFSKTKMAALDFTFSNVNASDQSALIRLKEAFQLYLRKDDAEVKNLIEEILRQASSDKKLDIICVELSEKLIDDMPHQDPRWAELSSKSKSFNSNLIITNQLKGKIKFHDYFLTFLKQYNLWEKLTYINYNGRNILTTMALEEHGEKLNCALVIREQLYTKNPELINGAIEYLIKNREEASSKLIYPHDIFFRRVSKVQDIFNAIFVIENEVIKMNSNEQSIKYLIDATQFLSILLETSQNFLREKAQVYNNGYDEDMEYTRWTFLPIKDLINKIPSIIALCIRQHKLCSEFGLQNCNSLENKIAILESLNQLDCKIFEEYETKLNSMDTTNESYANLKADYDSLKPKLLETFVKNKQTEIAVKLAEKYVDFYTMISVCEMRNDFELLEAYLDRFSNKNIADFIIKYFVDKKDLEFLFKSNVLMRLDLSRSFDKYSYLSWIKDIKTNRFQEASNTLEKLGSEEKNSFMKKNTLLSLSKLAILADKQESAADMRRLANLNRHLELMSYYENLTPNAIKSIGLAVEAIPAYKPEKLIEIMINDETATEKEFTKAFELIDFIDYDNKAVYTEARIKEIMNEILVHSILADNWERFYNEDYPETKLGDTKFFRTIDYLKNKNNFFDTLVSLKDDILDHELVQHLSSSEKFAYLLHTCFEMLQC